jgi:hypothetical protein
MLLAQIQHSKIQISDLLAEAEKKAAEYDDKVILPNQRNITFLGYTFIVG